MNAVHTEMLYFQRRLGESLAMADAAESDCARMAHETLARLYGEAVDALRVRPSHLATERMFDLVPRTVRTIMPRTPRPGARRMRATLRLAG